tara:strand:+ start:60 stop:455 length:396 start_codon:yes stop_codon:yes gene_type:complete
MKYFFILSFTLIFSCNLINNDEINEIDSDELTEFLQINDAILVDVRRDDEYINGHIENSINIDYMSDKFVAKTEMLDKNMPIILYCRSGRRSYLSAVKLSENGFKEVYNLKGGILSWIEIGNSVVFEDNTN